jgi:hypothetical protein
VLEGFVRRAPSSDVSEGLEPPNAVLSKVDADGNVCVYTVAATHLLIDVNGYVSALE